MSQLSEPRNASLFSLIADCSPTMQCYVCEGSIIISEDILRDRLEVPSVAYITVAHSQCKDKKRQGCPYHITVSAHLDGLVIAQLFLSTYLCECKGRTA